ncbi:MAG: type I-F CRISPR-associated endonuclease Cas1f [Rhodocyclaceae bacterium]|nr:type I-F CRISPR-associated endonuclease Cas1f [Rhodocyclaceae bacterium]
MRPRIKPKQILLSKRANVFYLEHVRVLQKDDRIVYLTNTDNEVERFFNIPERNTAFLLLGKGTSITDSAVRRLAESNVIVGFAGNGGSPPFSMVDYAFLSPLSEYRPTEYMQAWMKMWLDEAKRLDAAKLFQQERLTLAAHTWRENPHLSDRKIVLPDHLVEGYRAKIQAAPDTAHLMAVEAEWARNLYRLLARGFELGDFKREEGKQSRDTSEDLVNSYIDHGNYIAYGYAATALNALGISFALPVMHGKTRRGALVFDVADIYKDAVVLPHAFISVEQSLRDQEFRDSLIEICMNAEVMDRAIQTIQKVIE